MLNEDYRDILRAFAAEDAKAVLRALERFGAPSNELTKDDLVTDDMVFQIGVAPRRIDIITGATGLQFADAFERSVMLEIDGFEVPVLSLDDLIRNKRASGRKQDLAYAEALESIRDRQES